MVRNRTIPLLLRRSKESRTDRTERERERENREYRERERERERERVGRG